MPQKVDPEYAVVNLSCRHFESWMETGGNAMTVLGVTQVDDADNKPRVCAVIEVSNPDLNAVRRGQQESSRKELLPTSYLRTKCPQLLIQFYEDKITPM